MDSHREMRVDMSLPVSIELRYIKRESPVWIATLNIDMLLKSRAGKSRSKAEKKERSSREKTRKPDID